jgi:hypothetical protein
MKYFGVVENDVQNNPNIDSSERRVTVRCKGLMKLLPYDGFYPASRTAQLGSLFSQSYGKNIVLRPVTSGVQRLPNASLRTLYAPMFAPGVLFNTIKSGIAVDYPVITGSLAPNVGSTLTVSASVDYQNYYIANTAYDYRVPFESLVEPQNYIKNIAFIDNEPHPSCSIAATASWNGDGDDRYRLAMHNFLAETPEFFLDNGTFTSFVSRPEADLEPFISGTTYSMRVRIKKSFQNPEQGGGQDVSAHLPWIPNGKETITMYSRPSAFGPPVAGGPVEPTGGPFSGSDGAAYGGSEFGHNGPYTPPYWDGSAHAVLTFTPDQNRRYTISEIQASSSVIYQRYPNWNNVVYPAGAVSVGPMGRNGNASGIVDSTPELTSMQASASLNLFGKVSAKDLFKFQNVDLSEGNRWAIQTKFETPILNFIDVSSSAGLTTIVDNANLLSGGAETRPYGMWHQYGRLPRGDEGIFLEIDDPIFRPIGGVALVRPTVKDKSLADHLGFSKTEKKIGRVANKKVIREAVVVVPFLEENGSRQFFSIDKAQIDTALNNFTSGPQADVSGEPIVAGDSIRQMVDAMQRYVMPPSMDFINYPDKVDPFSMYVFEFTHELNQQDLADIWQNLPPRIARAFDKNAPDDLPTSEIKKTIEITHTLENGELLTTHPDKLQWMVFKVKQKAQKNYFNKTITNTKTSIPTSLSQEGLGQTLKQQSVQETDFLAGGSLKGATLKDEDFLVSYNWPYDFFSLVELAKVEEDVSFGRETAPQTVREAIAEATADITQEGVTQQSVSLGLGGPTSVAEQASEATTGLTQQGVSLNLGAPTSVAEQASEATTNITLQGAQVILSEENEGEAVTIEEALTSGRSTTFNR